MGWMGWVGVQRLCLSSLTIRSLIESKSSWCLLNHWRKYSLLKGPVKMSNAGKDHLTVTSNQSRDEGSHVVEVIHLNKISQTVIELALKSKISPVPFMFKPGQWVDFFIPEMENVGGFSITSSPHRLRTTECFTLAIKDSESPPSRWVHTKCKVGSQVSIRVGGDFVLEAESKNKHFLFIAGGVGINPLASMILELIDTGAMSFKDQSNSRNSITASLLFSAKTQYELIFKNIFDEAASTLDFRVKYFLTAATTVCKPTNELNQLSLIHGRIQKQDISNTIQKLSKDDILAYICGPPSFINAMKTYLMELGVKNVYYENWW